MGQFAQMEAEDVLEAAPAAQLELRTSIPSLLKLVRFDCTRHPPSSDLDVDTRILTTTAVARF